MIIVRLMIIIILLLLIVFLWLKIISLSKAENETSSVSKGFVKLDEQLGEFLGLTNKSKITENEKLNLTKQVDKNKSTIPDITKQIEEYEEKTSDLIFIILLCGLFIIAIGFGFITFFPFLK